MLTSAAFRPLRVIQGHWFWYKSKAHTVCDFLLVVVVTLVLSCTVAEILQVFVLNAHDPTPIPPILWVFPLDQIAHVGANVSRSLSYSAVKLFPTYSNLRANVSYLTLYLNVTDRRTDGQTTYCGITALCIASRGNNFHHEYPWTNVHIYWTSFMYRSLHNNVSIGFNAL